MSIVVSEHISSRRSNESESPSFELILKVITDGDDLGSDTEDIDVIDEVAAYLTANGILGIYNGLVNQSVDIDPVGPGVWTATVRYGLRKKPEAGNVVLSIDTSGGTHHITQSLATIAKYAPSGSVAPPVEGIGDTGEGRLEGVDIHIPAFAFSLKTFKDPATMTTAYIKTLYKLSGSVNDAIWPSVFAGQFILPGMFATGECLFLGASLSQSSSERWTTIDMKFVGSINANNLTVGGITGIVKKGHDYLWVRYAKKEKHTRVNPGSSAVLRSDLIDEAQAVYVEQVYPYKNFSSLGLGF